MLPSKIYSLRGYSILKSDVSAADQKQIHDELTVTPAVPPSYANTVSSFKVWMESPTRYYLPNAWGKTVFGEAQETRPSGETLPKSLVFQGKLRPHQEDALTAFRDAKNNGIICLPCGYGKTFTGIAAAIRLGVSFLIVVHKEFLASQWTSELQTLVPGIRIGRIQGEKCEIENVDCSIAMIQTLCSRHYTAGTFQRFGLAIFDEVHHLGAEHFSGALQRVNCRAMLGLTATPKRIDGLTKVFLWSLGPICYQIRGRPKDDSVYVQCYRFQSSDPSYTEVRTDWKGDPIRADLVNKIADHSPRTQALVEWILPTLQEVGRRLLILSDRREHLVEFDKLFRARGITDVGYYVGGMKQKDLDASANCTVILGTFAMASEGMNIPTLNTVLLATPKSNIEQSVGRILRLKPEERVVTPIIFDVLDTVFVQCMGQWTKRLKFYKECGYILRWNDQTDEGSEEGEAEEDREKGKPLFVEEEEEPEVKKKPVKSVKNKPLFINDDI